MTAQTDLLQWLASPLSGSEQHLIAPAVYWHARLMVLAWGFCLPLGAVAARYFKVTPGQNWPHVLDNKRWWHTHLALQYTGVVAMSLGLILVWKIPKSADVPLWSFAGVHQLLGWWLLALGWTQMVGGILRGSKGGPTDAHMAGDHYDMSRWRVVFECLHKSLGWLALALSIAVLVLGLLVADAPRWMMCGLCVWWLVLLVAMVYLQKRGCCIDTYQAIWGTHPSLPGMQRQPIGWGVRRTQQQPWRGTSSQP